MPRTRKPAISNRTDLVVGGGPPTGPTPAQMAPPNPQPSQPATQPIQVPTGQAYGEATAQRQAQQALPLPAGPTPGYDEHPVAAALRAMPFSPVGLGAPTQRPLEPVTAGAALGPGPSTPHPLVTDPSRAPTVAQTLNQLAAGDPKLAAFANLAASQGI